MKMSLIVVVLGIFLLIPVSAIYGGEIYNIEIEFEPVACSVTDNLSYNIIGSNIDIDIPINFVGNFTLTCFSGEEADPVIIYRGGGGTRTKYVDKNVTVYVDKPFEVEKIVEVPGKSIIEEKIIEVKSRLGTRGQILVGFLIGLVVLLLIWHLVSSSKRETHDIIEKGGKEKDE